MTNNSDEYQYPNSYEDEGMYNHNHDYNSLNNNTTFNQSYSQQGNQFVDSSAKLKLTAQPMLL